MPAEGIENKAGGWRAPQGALLGVDMHSVQHDPEIYTTRIPISMIHFDF